MDFRDIQPVSRPLRGRLRPPGSKSLTNRALIIAALAEGESHLSGVLDSVDTRVMLQSLDRLGIEIQPDLEHCRMTVRGCGGQIPVPEAELWCENSGTSIRFLTAMVATGRGSYRLDGNARMRERPIAPLVEALARHGVDVRCELDNGCPPVTLQASGLAGGSLAVAGDLSSQYLSGLLLAAPAARGDLSLEVQGELVSRPYVEMTLAIMQEFEAEVDASDWQQIRISASGYRGRDYEIEPDASAASYFFAAAAITGGEVTVAGLHRNSLQGDIGLVTALEQMGCTVTWEANAITVRGAPLRGIDIDMNAISDTAQTLACVAPFASGPTRIRNVAHMRLKETDRVAAVVTELRRAGLAAEEQADGLLIHPGMPQPAAIETYEDHRMAMSFALLGLRVPGIRILDPGCTAKTYPNYFEDLEMLCRGTR